MTPYAKNPAQHVSQVLYWTMVASSFLIGVIVVLPFYVYGIPVEGAGDLQLYDVKQYWPFAFQGPGAIIHDAVIVLAFVAPLLLPATTIWCMLSFFSSVHRRTAGLIPAALSVLIGLAYLVHWRAILAWHLD